MDPMKKLSIEQNRGMLDGLLFECPMGETLDDCPARELRATPIEKQRITVHAMTPEQVEDVVVRHTQCLKKREGR